MENFSFNDCNFSLKFPSRDPWDFFMLKAPQLENFTTFIQQWIWEGNMVNNIVMNRRLMHHKP